MNKKDNFSAPLQLNSAENGKAAELKLVNISADKTCSFLNI